MKNPRTALTLACLWLIPACVPYLSMGLPFMGAAYRTDGGGTLLYLLTTVLQTTSIFCFFGGLFTFLNLQKKGRTGGGPYFGLLTAVLAWLLSAMTANATISLSSRPDGITLDGLNFRMLFSQARFGVAAAGDIVKIVMQIAAALIPMIVLCILARRKSMKGRTPLTVLWVFLAVPTGALLLLLASLPARDNRVLTAVLRSLALVLAGGGLGGLLAYSYLLLLRRVPSFLFGLISVILAASLSCLATQYILMSNLGLRDTIWPQVLLAVFDGRLILIVTLLAFALRDYAESRPGSLVIALALLCGALLWGESNLATVYSNQTMTVPVLVMNLTTRTTAMVDVQQAGTAATVSLTGYKLLLAVPPLLMGTGAALLMKRAFAGPKALIRE